MEQHREQEQHGEDSGGGGAGKNHCVSFGSFKRILKKPQWPPPYMRLQLVGAGRWGEGVGIGRNFI